MNKDYLKRLIIVNMITGLRALGSLIIILIYFNYGLFWTGITAIIFFSTDWIDGLLARKWQCSTLFGALFDGMSDKLFEIISLSLLVIHNSLLIIPIIMEIIILIIGYNSAFKGNNVASSKLGKIKTVILGLTVILAFLLLGNNYVNNANSIIAALVIFLIVFDVLTIINYWKKDVFYTKNNKLYQEKMYGNKRIINQIKARKEMLSTLQNSIKNNNKKALLFDHEFYLKYRNASIEDMTK